MRSRKDVNGNKEETTTVLRESDCNDTRLRNYVTGDVIDAGL